MCAFVLAQHFGHIAPKHNSRNTLHRTPISSASATLPRPALVFVTPIGYCRDGGRALALAEAALAGGAAHIQLRDRQATDKELEATLCALLQRFDATQFVVNGSAGLHLAREYPGVGVHVREADTRMQLSDALHAVHPGALVGCSVHSVGAARAALRFGAPSYLQVGTMFATGSHPGQKPQGPALMRAIRDLVDGRSALIGVGGIDARNAAKVIQEGADGVAVITAISNAQNPRTAAADIGEAARDAYKI